MKKKRDAKTIWNFRNELVIANVMESLFDLFTRELEVRGIITHKGTIVDTKKVQRYELSNKNVHISVPRSIWRERGILVRK